MRYVSLPELLKEIFASENGAAIQKRLKNAQNRVDAKGEKEGQDYIDRNGSNKWSPLKHEFTQRLGAKCWYTEAVPQGSDLEIDHYRPKHHYRWMAFDPENFRVSCAFANSLHFNSEHGCAGGKHTHFPLRAGESCATIKAELHLEHPIILDPCNPDDCELLAFLPDGRPVIHPRHAKNPEACHRVEKSKLLLNLDHPDFNRAREEIYHEIESDVRFHERCGDPELRAEIEVKLARRLSIKRPFSVAARFYLAGHREKAWVEQILEKDRHSSGAVHRFGASNRNAASG